MKKRREKLKSITPFFLCLAFLIGCGQSIDTLKRYSKEQDAIARQVDIDKENFALLVTDIKEEKLQRGISRKRFIRIYGRPVIINKQEEEDAELELIYRDPLKFFDTPKVYLYFDKEDKLIRWVYEEPEQK